MVALGLVLLAVAAVLLIAEAHLSTGGLVAALAATAVICSVALLLIGAGAGPVAVLAVSGAVCAASVVGLVSLIRSVQPTRRLHPRSGSDAMVGHLGVVRAEGPASLVFVDGGLWRAQPSPLEHTNALHLGDQVVIESVQGLTVYVRQADELELNR